ncbi:MAG: ABC transporter permease [Denitrovibrio sp.]|nr:MAG: ABC transporter permease [Denitrovibrio sp.]
MNSKRKDLFWNIFLVVFLLSVAAGIYASSKKVDYIWRWNRLPQYVVYKDIQEVRAPSDGIVSVSGKTVKITPPGSRSTPVLLENVKGISVRNGDTVFEGDVLAKNESYKLGPLLTGLLITLEISVYSIFFAIIIGVCTGLARISRNPFLKKLAIFYIELIRGTPLLVQIFIFYYFIGTIFNLGRMTAGVMALSVFTGAYIAEIVRAGIQSVHKGQMEAARSLGMSYTVAMLLVILPQAFRRTLPPMAGQFISLIKDSSLVSVISITDLTKSGREIVASTFSPFEVWFTVAALYLVLTSLLSYLVQLLEKKMSAQDK